METAQKALKMIMAYESTEKRGNLLAGGFLPTFSINCFFLSTLIKFQEFTPPFPQKAQRRKLEYLTLLSLFFVHIFPSPSTAKKQSR